jgi:hypothetical protein
VLPPLDFNSAEAFAPATANVSISGAGSQLAITVTRLRTAHADAEISFLTNDELSATRTFFAIPEARLEAGDLQRIVATAHPAGPENDFRGASIYFHAPHDMKLALGERVPAPPLSIVAATPSLRIRALLANQADYDRLTSMGYQQGSHLVSVGMTPAYAALVGGYDLVVPDVSAAEGFDPSWALSAGQQIFWTVSRIGGSLGLGFDAIPTDGATQRTGGTFGTFEP